MFRIQTDVCILTSETQLEQMTQRHLHAVKTNNFIDSRGVTLTSIVVWEVLHFLAREQVNPIQFWHNYTAKNQDVPGTSFPAAWKVRNLKKHIKYQSTISVADLSYTSLSNIMSLGIVIWYSTWILRYFIVPAMIILLQIEHFFTMPIQESLTSATKNTTEFHLNILAHK